MAKNRAGYRKQLQEGLNTNFGLEYKRYTPEWKEIYDVETSRKAYEEDVLLTGFGAAPVKAEGATVSYDQGQEAWVARYVHETIALAFAITEEAEEDGLYGRLGAKYAKALARSMVHTKEVKGADILNRAFNASYTGGDGVELCSDAHPLVGGGTFANELSDGADLSEASIEDMLIGIEGFVDDRLIPISARGMKLIIPRQLRFDAERVLKSVQRSGTADNDINAMRSQGALPDGMCVNHRLTDSDAFFIKTDVPEGLKHMVRVKLQRGMEGDFETGNMRYKARERYVFGWSDPRGIYGSTGAD